MAAVERLVEVSRLTGGGGDDGQAEPDGTGVDVVRHVAEARQQAEQIVGQAEQRAAELDAESATQRRQVEEDFEITMSARRSETMHTLAEQEATSRSEAARRIDEATEAAG
ncbi:MAG: hypothetical protein ACRDSL_12605 [Pseudonocardiaceae bacterium]